MGREHLNTVHRFDKYAIFCSLMIFVVLTFGIFVATYVDVSNFSTKGHLFYANSLEYFNDSIDSVKNLANITKSDKISINLPNPVSPNLIKNNIPSNLSSNTKSGDKYCYYGEENGVRYCAKVQSGTKCMSDGVFKTKDVCMHPNLRY